MLPPIAGADVVDLGCGYGWFCRWAAARGPSSVLGLDMSVRIVEGPRSLDWIASAVMKQHRKVATSLTTLIASRLRITAVDEWHPTSEQLADHPEWNDHLHRPNFLLVAATKPT